MAETAFHFIQHAFAQRAVGQAQIADRQRIEHAAQDSQPRHEHRLAIFRQPRQAQRAEAFELQHLLGEHFQAIQVMRPSFSPIATSTSWAALMVPEAPSAYCQP